MSRTSVRACQNSQKIEKCQESPKNYPKIHINPLEVPKHVAQNMSTSISQNKASNCKKNHFPNVTSRTKQLIFRTLNLSFWNHILNCTKNNIGKISNRMKQIHKKKQLFINFVRKESLKKSQITYFKEPKIIF